MTTAYEDVREKLDLLVSTMITDVPKTKWAQLGAPTITCESLAIGITNLTDAPLFDVPGGRRCGDITIVDVVAMIGRDCAFPADDDGNTDPVRVQEASEKGDVDLSALRQWASLLSRPDTAQNQVQFLSEGGLHVVSLATQYRLGW